MPRPDRFARKPAQSSDGLGKSPTVFVIDDDADVRLSMKDLLISAGFRCETFAAAEDFLRVLRSDSAGCIILDVSLPGMNGLDFQQRLGEGGIRIPIIFLTAHGDIPMTVSAMKSGAEEFFTKPFDDEQLLGAVQRALARDRALGEKRLEIAAVRSRFELLTPRERQVMALVLTGMLNKQIAAELGTSVITIKVHRAQMMRKMQAGSLLELSKMAEKLR
ncbi:MAG: response regulator [Acidobacteriaceae bacterium]